MVINLEKEETRNKFVEFIKDENQSEIAMNGYIVLKRKYKNNQLLYCKYEYKNKLEGLSEQFEYKGFYNLVTNQFYGLIYPLEVSWETRNPDATTLKKDMEKEIKAEIVKYLADNHDTYFKDFSVQNNYNNEARLKSYTQDVKNEIFYNDKLKKLSDFVYLNWRGNDKETINEIDFDNVLEYIEAPEKCISNYKEKFLEKRKCDFYNQFENYQFYMKVYSDIQNNKSDVFHKQKAIKDALKDKKTANVTIFKDGQEFTFKTESDVFTRWNDYYSYLRMDAKDRRKYEELFNYEKYTIDEILKITYGKNEIYNKEKYNQQSDRQTEENQNQ